MARTRHPKPPVEKALKYAEENDWEVTPTAAGHRWGKAACGNGCSVSVWSTPKNSDNHGKAIRRAVDKCPH
jgi:hypothetical protein